MHIDKLERVITIFETGSFRKAAQKLGLSQPALTWSIRQLEESLDVRLFDRGPNGVRPTEVCHQMIGRAKLIVSTHNRLVSDVGQYNSSQTVRLGVHPVMFNGDFARCLARFGERHPQASLHITEGYSSVLLAALERGELDFAYCGHTEAISDFDGVEFEPVSSQTYSIVGAPSHPIFQDIAEGTLPPQYAWVQAEVPNLAVKDRNSTEIDEIFRKFNRQPEARVVYTTSMSLIRLMIQEGGFLGLIADEFIQDQLESGVLKRLPGSQVVAPPVGFVSLSGSYETNAMEKLKSMLRQLHGALPVQPKDSA